MTVVPGSLLARSTVDVGGRRKKCPGFRRGNPSLALPVKVRASLQNSLGQTLTWGRYPAGLKAETHQLLPLFDSHGSTCTGPWMNGTSVSEADYREGHN